jgi:hypothetical protein
LASRYGIHLIAVHRKIAAIADIGDDFQLQFGDVLLVEGAPSQIQRFCDNGDLFAITERKPAQQRRDKAPVAVATAVAAPVAAPAPAANTRPAGDKRDGRRGERNDRGERGERGGRGGRGGQRDGHREGQREGQREAPRDGQQARGERTERAGERGAERTERADRGDRRGPRPERAPRPDEAANGIVQPFVDTIPVPIPPGHEAAEAGAEGEGRDGGRRRRRRGGRDRGEGRELRRSAAAGCA